MFIQMKNVGVKDLTVIWIIFDKCWSH